MKQIVTNIRYLLIVEYTFEDSTVAFLSSNKEYFTSNLDLVQM